MAPVCFGSIFKPNGDSMNTFACHHCENNHFATLCSDCLVEEIHIQETRSALHIGRCHRCGHVDAEPCPAAARSGTHLNRTKQIAGHAFGGLSRKTLNLAAGTTHAIRHHFSRIRSPQTIDPGNAPTAPTVKTTGRATALLQPARLLPPSETRFLVQQLFVYHCQAAPPLRRYPIRI